MMKTKLLIGALAPRADENNQRKIS